MVRETRHLWVGNLPENIKEDRIIDHFKRYGKVQSVKILAKNNSSSKCDDNNSNSNAGNSGLSGCDVNNGGVSATVAFIDLKSAAKARNSENKIEERTLKTDYYDPPASSTALSAIYIHEREDAHVLVQKPGVQTNIYGNPIANSRSAGRHTPNRLSDERLYDRDSRTGSLNNYDRIVDTRDSPYIKRNIGYLDDSDYPNRSRSRDRPFSRNVNNNNNNNSYGDQLDNRSQSHFRSYSRTSGQHFDGQRYPSTEQLLEEPNVNSNTSTTTSSAQRPGGGGSASSGGRRITSVSTTAAASGGVSSTVSSPPLKKKKKKKSLRSHSASPSPSRSSSLSSARSQSPSSSSNISTSSASSRSPSPAKSQSSLSQLYGGRKERSGSNSVLISAATTTNNISTSSQGSNHTPLHNSGATPGSDSSADKDDTRPVAICVKNLPVRSTDSSLKDGLFHEYKKHGKVTMVKVVGQGTDRFAVVCFKKPEDVDKALVESKDKLFFGCKIEVSAHEGIDAEDNDFRPLEAELDEHHPKATRTLFVGNLEKDVSTSDLKSHFEQFGEIIEIDIKKQGNMSSYAFIQFSDISSVVKAMRKLDGENLGQNRIKLGFGKSMPTNCVWIHGLGDGINEKSLLWHANRFGTVVNLVLDRQNSNSLIFYDTVECAQIAVQDLKGRVLSGRKLQVDFASRECQTAFFDFLESSGQPIPGGERPWIEARSGRQTGGNSANNWQEFDERIPNYDSHTNSNRSVGHSRYQSRMGRNYRPQSPLPPFGRNSQTGYGGRGRAYQRFAQLPSDSYSEDFVERRHRNYDLEDYDDNEDGFREEDRDSYIRDRSRELSETCSKAYSPVRSESPKDRRDGRSTSPFSKSDISNNRDKSEDRLSSKEKCSSRRPSEDVIHDEWKPSASDSLDRRRPKHKSCDSDIVICHSPPPPVARRLSHSKSPLPKEKTPALVNNNKGQNTPQSPTASPCSSSFASPLRTDCTDIDVDKEFEPSCGSSNVWRRKSVDESHIEIPDTLRIRSDSVSDSSDNGFVGRESLKRKRIDSDSPDTPTSSEAPIGHLERKKRLLACLSSSESIGLHKDRLGSGSNSSQSTASSKTSSAAEQQTRREFDSFVTSDAVKSELAKLLKRRNSSSGGANSDIKYLESKSKGSLISVIEQCIFEAATVGHNTVEATGGHHPLVDTLAAVDSKPRSKHNINISTKSGKCSYGAKDSGAAIGVPALRIIDATLPLVNHSWPDPRRQLAGLSTVSNACSAQLCSTHTTNCKQIHRKLERSDAIYEMSCDSDVSVVSRVSSSDIECTDRTLLKQDLVHTTTPKLEDHCSSEVSSSSDKVANALNKAVVRPTLRTCPLSLPLPEFAITSRAGGTGTKVQNIPVVQPSHPSPKSTTIMSPLGQMSPNSVVPKVKTKHSTDVSPVVSVIPVVTPVVTKEIQCLVSTTDNPDSNTTLSDIKPINVTTSSTKEVILPTKTEQPFDEVSDPEMSPNRSPTIEERIKALDEKYNAWSGTTTNTAQTLTKIEKTPTPTIDYSKYNIKKKSQISATSSTDSQTSEPSDIVKNLLSKSSIFDQDSKRLELINEKYEPKDLVSMNYDSLTSPITKPVFRTKAAAKEFSTPVVSNTLPTDKDHSLTPKTSSLSHHSSHHSLHSSSSVTHHSSQVHHSTGHPIPGALSRKLSEPTRMPSVKKEPLTPTTPLTPAPNSAPAGRTGSNPFAPFGRSSSHNPNVSQTLSSATTPATASAVTRLPQSNLLGGLNIKKESTILSVNNTIGPTKDVPKQPNRDPRENRDPRVVAKKDISLHNSIVSNTSAMNMQSIKDQTNSSVIKKELNPTVKNEFQKKASQLSTSLPPHLASSGFSSKAQSFPTPGPVNSRPEQLIKQKSDQQLSANKKHSISDVLETTDSDGWSRLTNDSKDKSLKSDKIKHHSQNSSQSKDNFEANVQKNKSTEKSDKKSLDINKSVDKNKIQTNISNKSIKDEKKCLKNKESKPMFKTESKEKDKESKDKSEKSKSKSLSDVKSEKKSSDCNPNKEKTSKSEKESKKDKKDKNCSKDKSKDGKLKASEIRMLLSIPDTDEPIYFSMYDKVKARSSANQNLKVAKDLECVRQKFSQLKDKRQHQKHDDKNKTSQDTDSDSDDSLQERIANKHKKSLQKKRKIIIDTSSNSSSDDDDLLSSQQREQREHQKTKKKLASISKDMSDSDSDIMGTKPVQKPIKKLHKEQIYTSDSSMDDLMASMSSPKMSTNSVQTMKKIQKLKNKSSDDSSDDDVSHKQMKKKKELKKKVKKDKSDKTKVDLNVTKESIKTDKTEKLDKTEKSDKTELKSEKTSHSLSDNKSQSLEKIKKNKLPKDKDNICNTSNINKEQKKRKESSGTDNDNDCKQQQKLAKRKKKKAKICKLSKEKRHSSSSGRDRTSSMASDEKPPKHSNESSSNSSSVKQVSNAIMSDHELRSSGMSDLEECLKRDYPDVKSDESDSETRTHVLKCYNKESSHKEKHTDSQPSRGVVSHTEWEKSETTKPSNEKSVQNPNTNSNIKQVVNKSCAQPVVKTEKPDQKSGIKSPKKMTKESMSLKEGEICGKTKEKKENKTQKEDKQSIKDELKRKKLKKQIKNKEKDKEKESKDGKDRKDKSVDKELKEKSIEKTSKDIHKEKDKDKDKEKERLTDKEKEVKKIKPKEELFKPKSPSPPPKTPDLHIKTPPSPSYSDLMATNDSSSSDSKVDEDLLKNARMLEECMRTGGASDDTNSSSEDLIMPSGNHSAKPLTQIPITNLIKPTKEEQKQQRRYEEEAAIQSLRLQKELMEERTDHLIKDMKRPFEELTAEITAHHSIADITSPKIKPSIDESIFAMNSVSNKDLFAADVETVEKCDDTKELEIDDQRKMEDDLAVAALLQDMNDPIVKDTEEYKEPEEYVPPTEQIDEISYMGMLGDEEPPLQIAESPPEALHDETCAALKSISEELSEKSPPIIEKLIETNEELNKELEPNELKTETIVQSIVEEIKKESNEWQTTNINNESENSSAVLDSIEPEINSIENIIKSPETKTNETIEVLNEKSEPFVEEFVPKEEPKQLNDENNETIDNLLDNKSQVIDSSIDSSVNSSLVEEKPEQKESIVREDNDTNELNVSRLLSPSPLLPSFADSVTDDKRDTCSDGGVSDRTEIFDEEVDTEPQPTEVEPKDVKPVVIPTATTPSVPITIDTKPLINISPIDTKPVLNDESRDESESDDKRTCERPRRGRRAKTRKYSESSLQLPRYETGCVSSMATSFAGTIPTTITTPPPTQTSTPLKRGPKPVSDRVVRTRSGRTSGLESSNDDHQIENDLSGDEHQLKIDEQPPHQTPHEDEPKKVNKRGRKKKISGTELPKPAEECQKKERILLSLPLPTEKPSTDVRKSNSPYDVFEFRDSDEEDSPQLPLESIHKQSSEHTVPKCQQIATHSVPEVVESPIKSKHTVIEETPVIKPLIVPPIETHHTHTHQTHPHQTHPHQTHPHQTHPHQDQTSKEYVSEVSQHGKISITIRLHPKEGQDGVATSTAEVVKTSKALLSEETDNNSKQLTVKASVEQQAPAVDPQTSSKGVRKSARLMSQVPKTTVDETIEDVIKGSHKEESKSKRITRSSRKSEESNDLEDDHNDDSKNVLRSYRITRSSTRGSITAEADNSNDNSNSQPPIVPEAHDTTVNRRSTLPQLPVLKVELPKIGLTSRTTAEQNPKRKPEDNNTTVETIVEPKIIANIVPQKDINETTTTPAVEVQDDSRASPAVLLDPVTGLLEPVQKKAFEHTAVIQAIKPIQTPIVTTIASAVATTTAPATGVVCQSPAVITNSMNTNTTNATTSVITPPNHSVITSAAIQDIPNISDRIHGSTTAVKLKTGKPFNPLPEIEKPVVINTTTETTTPVTTPAPIEVPITTTTTQAQVSTVTVKPTPAAVVETAIAPPMTPISTAIVTHTTQPQPITITPKYPPPVGQPLVPIAQPMPGQWPPNLVPPSVHSQSRQYPQTVSQPVVTTQHNRPTIPSMPSFNETKPKIEIQPQNVSQPQPTPQPPPAHQKLTLEPKAPPSMPTSVVTSHSSAETQISPPVHTKHESRRDSISKSSKYGSGLQIAGYPTPAHETPAHISVGPNLQSMANRGVIEELLQNPHLLPQQKQELLVQLNLQRDHLEQLSRERSVTPASIHESASVRNSVQTPTPTDAQNPLIPPHMAGLMRPPSQAGLIHPHLGLHPSDMQMQALRQEMMAAQYIHSQHYNSLPDLRARQEAQGLVRAAMNLPPRFVYPTGNFQMPLTPEVKAHELNVKERERQERQERQQQQQEERAHKRESREKKESGRESVGRLTHQEEVDFKSSIQRQAEAELKRQAETHDRILSSMQPPPPLAPLRIPGMPYPPPHALRQFAPHLLSPHERYTDSPAIVYSQGRPQSTHQMRAEELKQQEVMRRSPIVKMDDSRKYQTPSDFSQLHRQQLTSPSPQYTLDGRSMQPPAHSPGAHYRKESTRSPMTASNEAEVQLRKQMMANQYPNKEMAQSPGPLALNMSAQQLSAGGHLQLSHNQNHMPNEGLIRRAVMHPIPQLGSEPPIHGPPPPAHAISQSAHHQTMSDTPQHASQVPQHGDALLQRYPVMWQGLFALKNDQAAVQMHYVSGNMRIAQQSLPPFTEGGVSPLRIAQRMRLEPQQLQGLARKIQSIDEHCILLALPCGRDHMDVLQQSNNLKTGFITYLQSKQAAGIVNMNAPGSNQAAYVVHIFPTCEFSHENLVRIAPDLLHSLQEISHLLVVIATV